MTKEAEDEELEQVVSELIEAGEDLPDDVEERLVNWEGEESRRVLVDVLLDEELAAADGPERHASIHAARILGERGEPEAVPALVEILEELDALAIVFTEAVKAIGAIGESALEPTLEAFHAAAERRDLDDMRGLIEAAFETGAVGERLSEALAVEAEFDPDFARELLYEYERTDEVVEMLEEKAETVADIPEEMRSNASRIEGICRTLEEFGGEVPTSLNKYTDGRRTTVGDSRDGDEDRFFPPKQGTPSHRTNEPYVDESPDVGRNDPCPCGSGRKYKKCCMRKE